MSGPRRARRHRQTGLWGEKRLTQETPGPPYPSVLCPPCGPFGSRRPTLVVYTEKEEDGKNAQRSYDGVVIGVLPKVGKNKNKTQLSKVRLVCHSAKCTFVLKKNPKKTPAAESWRHPLQQQCAKCRSASNGQN